MNFITKKEMKNKTKSEIITILLNKDIFFKNNYNDIIELENQTIIFDKKNIFKKIENNY